MPRDAATARAVEHAVPECIVEVSVALWTESGWTERRLSDPGEQLILEDFGLHCTLADLYRGTALQPRGKQ